jgi:cytochrome P450
MLILLAETATLPRWRHMIGDSPFVYDPASEAFAGHAYEIYRELRDAHPVYRNEERGTWALSRYEDVRRAAGRYRDIFL